MQEKDNKIIKKRWSWWKTSLRVLLLLFVLLIGVVQFPTVQTWLAKKASEYLSKELEAKVEVERARVNFFLDFVLINLSIQDRKGNDMIQAGSIRFDVQSIAPFSRKIGIRTVELRDANINLYRIKDSDELNIDFLIDYFSRRQQPEHEEQWTITTQGLKLSESFFSFTDHNFTSNQPLPFMQEVELKNLSLDARNFSLQNDTLSLYIAQFGFEQNNGFTLNNLSAKLLLTPTVSDISNLAITTPNSQLNLSAQFTYDSLASFSNFSSDVNFNIELGGTTISMLDITHFVPSLDGMDASASIKGNLRGTLDNLRADSIKLLFGRNTIAAGNFHLRGLPNIHNTFFNLNIRDLQTSVSDVNSFQLPYRSANRSPQLPATLTNLGRISFNGWVTGFINDMVAFGNLNTSIGKLSSDIRLLIDPATGLPGYKGEIVTNGFNVGKFLGAEQQLGLFSLNAVVEGRGLTRQTADLNINGNIVSAEVLGYNFENVSLKGDITNQKFNGELLISDPNISLDFNGMVNFESQEPIFDFYATVENANLTRLNIFSADTLHESVVSGRLNVSISEWQPHSINGLAEFINVSYERRPIGDGDSKIFTTGPIILKSFVQNQNEQVLHLTSDFLDAGIEGRFQFNQFVPTVNRFLATYLPSRFIKPTLNLTDKNGLFGVRFNMNFKDTRTLTELFFPTIAVSENAYIKGKFGQHYGDLQILSSITKLEIDESTFSNLEIEGWRESDKYHLKINADSLLMAGRFTLDNFSTGGSIANDSIAYFLNWRSNESPQENYGNISGNTRFIDEQKVELRIFPSYLVFNRSEWYVNPGNRIILDSARTEIRNFLVTYGDAYALADGILSPNSDEYLLVEFNEFNTEALTELLHLKDLDFAGDLSGFLTLGNLAASPRIEANLSVAGFRFNHHPMGDLHLWSTWNNLKDAFSLDLEIFQGEGVAQVSPLRAKGYFFPQRTEDNFDLAITANDLPMSIWGRYLDSFANKFDGLSSGNLRLDGSLQNPKLSGRLWMENAGMRINFLNTEYTFSDSIRIERNQFVLQNMVITDSLGNQGLVNGRIMHNNFNDFALDLRIAPDRMAILNTTQDYNDVMFYGRGFASGMVIIYGPADNLSLNIRGRTNRGTQIYLPLDLAKEVGETHFISFVGQEILQDAQAQLEQRGGNLSISIELEITPDAEVQLVMDSRTGDQIRGRGRGILTMEAPPDGNFTMMGDFTIGEGEYLFNLQNIINKRFRIQEGGTIRWNGDPMGAMLDIRAIYRTRTPLYDLFMNLDTSEVFRRRVPVETNLLLSGNLINPAISFEITLPGADEATREMLSRVITTDQEMNRQVFSLLVLNRFLPTSIDQYNTALGFGVGSTSSEMLSNQLSNWLSQISNDFDIGINYRPGDLVSSQELEVALSTQLFNDRVTIDGNLGMAGQNPALSSRRTSTIVGDINVEVRITPEGRFRVKAFNRSNAFEVLENQAPYTQGVGVFYRREFDNFRDLLRRYRQTPVEQSALEATFPTNDL